MSTTSSPRSRPTIRPSASARSACTSSRPRPVSRTSALSSPAMSRSAPAASSIATGSSPVVPPIEGLDTVEYLTNETIFELTRRPGHLIIVGGGPVGIELAQAYRRLGSEVTVVEAGGGAGRAKIPSWPRSCSSSVRADGVTIRERHQGRARRATWRGLASRVDVEASGARSDRGDASADCRRPRRQHRRARSRKGRHQPWRVTASRCRPKLRTSQSPGLCDRRRRRRARRNSPMSPAIMPAWSSGRCCSALSARERPRHHPAGHLHRSRTRPCRADRGRGDRAQAPGHAHPALAALPRTTAPRPSAGPRAISSWWPDAKGGILGASIVGANAGEMIGLWALALVQADERPRNCRLSCRPIRPWAKLANAPRSPILLPQAQGRLVRKLIRFLRVFGR